MSDDQQHLGTLSKPVNGVRRQAVVLIHGIGEQRPMATLRGFVDGLVEPKVVNGTPEVTYHSKPDTLSESFELRRYKLRRVEDSNPDKAINADWPETDFYEYYWAHQMYGTTFRHILSWLWRLMSEGKRAAARPDWTQSAFHPRLRFFVYLGWALALTVASLIILGIWFGWSSKKDIAAVTGIVAIAVYAFKQVAAVAQNTILDFAGDAARYFDVTPTNVARRYDILKAGVAMLRRLHEECDTKDGKVMYRYDRVVLIGHSLGSVIAYDLLKHFWPEVNPRLPVDPNDLLKVEAFVGGNGAPPSNSVGSHADGAAFRRDQHEAWKLINKQWYAKPLIDATDRPRWIVTDLVTLGSPLTYAPLLMADGLEDLLDKKRRRELSTCPPDRSRHLNPGHFVVPLQAEADRLDSYPILPQGAYFALSRWTNLYFTNDPIGGSLQPNFLNGIDDQNLGAGPSGLLGGKAHTSYWNPSVEPALPCIAALRRILKNNLVQ